MPSPWPVEISTSCRKKDHSGVICQDGSHFVLESQGQLMRAENTNRGVIDGEKRQGGWIVKEVKEGGEVKPRGSMLNDVLTDMKSCCGHSARL